LGSNRPIDAEAVFVRGDGFHGARCGFSGCDVLRDVEICKSDSANDWMVSAICFFRLHPHVSRGS